jgi:hypothetical protein
MGFGPYGVAAVGASTASFIGAVVFLILRHHLGA